MDSASNAKNVIYINNTTTYIFYTSEDLKWYAQTVRWSVISKRYWYLAIEKLKWNILILQRFNLNFRKINRYLYFLFLVLAQVRAHTLFLIVATHQCG